MPWPKTNDEDELLLWNKRQRKATITLYSARKSLRNISRQILLFQQIMSHAPDPNKTGVEIPVKILQAYIYLFLAIAQGSSNTNLYWSHMRTFSRLMQVGMRTMLKSFSPSSILTYSSILPTDIVSLMSLKLLGDLTGTCPNISNVYSQWIKTLVSSHNDAQGQSCGGSALTIIPNGRRRELRQSQPCPIRRRSST